MSFELQRKLVMSNVFKDYYRDAMDGEHAFKGKIWPLKVVKNICNELLEGFLKSKRSRFKDYFKIAMKKKFSRKNSKQRKVSFILTLFFSIEKRADDCFEMDVIKSFFTSNWKKSVFRNWMKARKAIFRAKGLNYSNEVQLDELFLSKSQVLILAQKTCNESIEIFEKWLEDEIARVKELRVKVKRGGDQHLAHELEKNQKFYRIDKTASSAVLWKIMRYFFKIEINQMEQEKREEIEKKLSNVMKASTEEVLEVDDDGNVIANDRVSRASSINNDIDKEQVIANMEMEKRALVKEIERNHREANLKYQACILMAGLTRATQEIFQESKEELEETGVVIKEYIDEVNDEDLKKKMFHQMGGFFAKEFFDKGSKLYTTAFDDLIKKLKKTPDMIKYNVDLEHRSRSYGTHCNTFQKLTRFVVFQNHMRFKVKRLSKKEQEQRNLEHILKGVETSEYRLKSINIPKDKIHNELIDKSVRVEDEIHEIVEEEDEYRMKLLTQKLQEQAKVNKAYLEDPEFTSSIGVKTKPNKFKNFIRQLSRVSETGSEANSKVNKEEEKEDVEGEKRKSVITENVDGEDSNTNRMIENKKNEEKLEEVEQEEPEEEKPEEKVEEQDNAKDEKTNKEEELEEIKPEQPEEEPVAEVEKEETPQKEPQETKKEEPAVEVEKEEAPQEEPQETKKEEPVAEVEKEEIPQEEPQETKKEEPVAEVEKEEIPQEEPAEVEKEEAPQEEPQETQQEEPAEVEKEEATEEADKKEEKEKGMFEKLKDMAKGAVNDKIEEM